MRVREMCYFPRRMFSIGGFQQQVGQPVPLTLTGHPTIGQSDTFTKKTAAAGFAPILMAESVSPLGLVGSSMVELEGLGYLVGRSAQ